MINKKISVVIPCYNEEENILEMYKQLRVVLDKITDDYEIIYTDNNSIDNSGEIFKKLAAQDSRVSVIFFSRNFGSSDIGYTAGTEYATGDAVVWIDGDIQDPPELIEEFVKKWQEGYDIIYGIRSKREGSFLRKIGYKLFYRLFKTMSYIEIPLDVGDFCLMDRKVVNAFNLMEERDRIVRGLRAWVGFKNIGIKYTRVERKSGVASTNLLKYFSIAKKAIFSFSYVPLELISYLAFFIVILSILGIFIYFILYFVLPDTPKGIPTIIILVLFLGSIQLLCLSIIGEYLAKIFEETKKRPKYIIKEILNDHKKNKSSKAE